MHIKDYDVNRLTTDQEDAIGVRFARSPELLKTSDIVTLHVPLDKSTHNLIGGRAMLNAQSATLRHLTMRNGM